MAIQVLVRLPFAFFLLKGLKGLFLTTCCQKMKFSARPGLRIAAYASESAI